MLWFIYIMASSVWRYKFSCCLCAETGDWVSISLLFLSLKCNDVGTYAYVHCDIIVCLCPHLVAIFSSIYGHVSAQVSYTSDAAGLTGETSQVFLDLASSFLLLWGVVPLLGLIIINLFAFLLDRCLNGYQFYFATTLKGALAGIHLSWNSSGTSAWYHDHWCLSDFT